MQVASPRLTLNPDGNTGTLPITGVQRVLDDPLAVVDATIVFSGRIQVGDLFAAAEAVCRRHEALRTTVHPAESVQIIHEYRPSMVAVDHRTADPGSLLDVLDAAAQEPLDPTRLPVLRCTAVTDGRDRTAVHLGAPHTVSDRESMQVVTGDFLAFLRCALTAQPSELEPIRAQYADYLRWRAQLCADERTWAAGGSGERAVRYWSEKLRGARTPAFGRSRGGSNQLDRMTFLRRTIGPDLTGRLLQVCHSARCSTFQVVLAAFEEAVARQTGTEDVSTMCMVHGRGRAELRHTVGLLTEETAFRHCVRAGSRRDYLTSLARDVLLTYAYQDIPLASLIDRSQEVGRFYALRRFRAMYLHFRPLAIGDGLAPHLPGVEVSFPRTGGSWPAFRLPGGALFSVDQNEDRLEVELMYDGRVWPDHEMRRLMDGFAEASRSFADRPDEPLSVN